MISVFCPGCHQYIRAAVVVGGTKLNSHTVLEIVADGNEKLYLQTICSKSDMVINDDEAYGVRR